MPILDPTYLDELEDLGSHGTQTLAFVNKILKGLLYVELSVDGNEVSGQVKTGDGVDRPGSLSVELRALCQDTCAMLVTTGAAGGGDGSDHVWAITNASGQFVVEVDGSGPSILVLATPTINGVTQAIEADDYL